MTPFLRTCFLCWSFLCAGTIANSAPMQLPQPVLETLPNGLEVVWFTSDRIPIIDLMLMVKSGERDDLDGKSGTANLLSASLNRGAGGKSATQLAQAIEKLGASRSIATDDDSFILGIHGLSSDSAELLNLLSLTVLKPDFLESEIMREHERIVDRWRHLGDSADLLASVAFQRRLMAGTHYGRSGLLSVAEFSRVSRTDVFSYYQNHFTPKNSLLMVVGQVNRQEFKKKILNAFGGWKGEAPQRQWKNYTDPRVMTQPGQILLVDRPDLTQAQVRMGIKAPNIHSPDRYPLTVANALFGEYFNSRLVSVIRDQMGLTYGIASGFTLHPNYGRFSILSSTRSESVGPLLKETLNQLNRWASEPIPKEEVQTAKDYLVGGYPLGVSSLGAVASRWLTAHVMGLEPNSLAQYPDRISKVTEQEVSLAVKNDIHPDQVMIVIAGDAKAIRLSLEKSGFHKIKTLKPNDLN